jgi:hypothetical protein
MAMQTMVVNVVGDAPLLMHNGQLADPLNKWSKALKELSGQRKKTEEVHVEMSRIEWLGGLYVNGDGKAIIPSECIEAAIYEGAKKQKLGKAFKSAVFVYEDAVLDIGTKKKLEDLWGDDNYRDTRGVRIGTSRIMRTRPVFKQWKARFEVAFDDEQVNASDVERAVNDAGRLVGFLDYRPKFGRFSVVD